MARRNKAVTGIWILVLVVSLCVLGVGVWKFSEYRKKEEYRNEPEPIKRIRKMYTDIEPLKKDIPIREGTESYTMNKKSITMCLKNPKTGDYYSWNTLAYVALHELAHVVTKQKEKDKHGPIFTKNFLRILKKAKGLGYYNPEEPIPDHYCGVKN
jgi:hypothetical protein